MMQTEREPNVVETRVEEAEDDAPAMLQVKDLVKTFPPSRSEKDRVAAVNGVSFDVPAGQMYTLLGPSGCGKTTTLRCIAGLERPDRGEIVVSDRVLFSSGRGVNLPANERGLGMVFQSYAIWPHMNVFRNVAFPLQVLQQRERPDKREIAERVGEVLRVVRLDHLADREATDLSGGQQQRPPGGDAVRAEAPPADARHHGRLRHP
jgi:iron(III) transport system ATP-binding protein